MTYFLGIDQSYTSCGVVLLNDRTELISYTTIKSTKSDDIFARARYVTDVVAHDWVDKYHPLMIGLEGLAFSKFGDATRDLAGLQFTLVNHFRGVYTYDTTNLLVVSPNELKKYATGKGNAKKEQMVASLPKDVVQSFKDQNYKKTTGLYDLADAYWIAKYVLEAHQKQTPTTKS